ncbi:MAG: hypothetical protein DRG59_05690 [Deltaproteobacteria bacterium]|nr:MAG: hypothetical protein DRG59_05690 [Deltaproteobacteria bacterium]
MTYSHSRETQNRRKKTPFVFLFVLLSLFLSSRGYSWDSNAYDTGKSLGSSMHHKLDSTGKIRNRFSNPMTSSATAMKTMDDSKSFTAQLTAPSSDVFLDLFVGPSGTGDLTTVTIKQDINFDGTPDYVYSLSSPVSGVCSNGFISADVGTWEHRHYYTWVADANGRVTASEVPSIDSLAGCYCINSSCGSNLVWSNINIILRDLGGGIVSAIQQQKTFTITSVDVTGTEIKYYGQATSTMGNTSGVYFSGTPNPEQYYNDGHGSLPGDVELANQAADPNSMYSQLQTLNMNVGNQYTTKTCSIIREASIYADMVDLPVISITRSFCTHKTPQSVTASGTSIRVCGEAGCCTISLHGFTATGSGNVSYWGILEASGNTLNLGGVIVTLHGATATIGYPCTVYGCPPGAPGMGGWVENVSSTELMWYGKAYHKLFKLGSVIFHSACPDGYTLDPTGTKCIRGNPTATLNTTDTCNGIDLTNCTLSEETVCDHDDKGCVYTFKNHNPTGLTPVGSCYSEVFPYTGETWIFCADGTTLTYQNSSASGVLDSGTDIWWRIHRTYTCEANDVYDFTKAQQRAEHIQDTLSDNGTTLTFQDLNADTGETTNVSTDLPPREDVERCEKSCRVRVPVQDTQASPMGTTSDYRSSVNTYKEVLRGCENGVCPVNPGETMIQDCQCTNYFLKAATTLQLLENAGRDIICSSSPP